ncbi:MAG: hypothetical protein ABIH37_00570 [archaeon]
MDSLTLYDAVKIADIGMKFGRIVADATGHPMDVSGREELLKQMIPYKEIFQPIVQASVDELNRRHPLRDGTPRFNYQIK